MNRRAWVLFVAMSLIWGVPYLLIREAVAEVSPAVVVFARTAIGAVILLPFAWKKLRQMWRHRGPAAAFAVVEILVPWFLLSDAERHLSSSLTGLLVALTPVLALLLARATGMESRISGIRVLGLGFALAGMVALGGGALEANGWWPVLEVLLAAVGYAVAPQIAARSHSEVPALPLTAACLLFTAVLSATFAAFSWPREVPGTAALGSLLGLGVLCTAVAFLLFFRLIAEAGPARATAIAYVNPVVALALGVTLHGDPFAPVIAAGSVLVLLGTVLATRGPGATAGAQEDRGGEGAGSAAGERSRVPENTARD